MATMLCLSKSHQDICCISFLSELYKKYTQTTLIFRPAKSGRKKYIKQRRFFDHRNYIEKARQNDEETGNLSIFSFFDVSM